jgi:hypothetical protein
MRLRVDVVIRSKGRGQYFGVVPWGVSHWPAHANIVSGDAGSETKAVIRVIWTTSLVVAKNVIGMMAEVIGVLRTVLNQSGSLSIFTRRLCKGNLEANRRHIIYLYFCTPVDSISRKGWSSAAFVLKDPASASIRINKWTVPKSAVDLNFILFVML